MTDELTQLGIVSFDYQCWQKELTYTGSDFAWSLDGSHITVVDNTVAVADTSTGGTTVTAAGSVTTGDVTSDATETTATIEEKQDMPVWL